MVGLISIIIIIVISFVMMMEGWEKYDSQKFYTGLLVIGISIIMIFPVMQYNMENMKNVCKFKKLNEMKLDDYGFGLFEYNGVLYFKEAEGERCFDVRSGNEVIIGKDKIVTALEERRGRGSNAALFAELRSKASGETGRPRIAYIYHLVSFIL